MNRRMLMTLLAGAGTGLVMRQGVRAATLVERNVESRLALALRLPAAAVQRQLSGPWETAGQPPGPFAGANLFVLFYDRAHALDGAGQVPPQATARFVVLAPFARSRDSGESAFVVSRIYLPDASLMPGPYRNGVPAETRRRFSSDGPAFAPGTASEAWEMQAANGDRISLSVDYRRGRPTRAQRELRIYSSVEPGFHRIYRTDEVLDVVRSRPAGIDRADRFSAAFAVADLPELAEAEVVAVTAYPLYLRDVSLP
ncbi:hypothetical protein [Falsiroseomonas sp. CW058]|uniref:hypothetical protein n=1 Tax=Falsiroseomonas sp. CW058 TaxID=3388664 RepID=UPI003D32145F